MKVTQLRFDPTVSPLGGRNNTGKLEMGNGADEQQHAGSDAKGKDLDQTGSGASNGGGVFALTTRVYRRRWVMLILFSTFSMSNAFQWIQCSIISNIIAKFYGVEMSAVSWLSMIYMVSYIVLIVPAAWLLEKRGLRIALLLANMLNCAGAWIKVASARPDLYWVTVLGQFLSATSQVLFLGIPPKLAAVWFGPDEVSVACSIGVLGNQLGIAIGFLVPPILVHNVDDLDELGYHIRVMFYITAGVTTVMFILVIMVFQDKPEIPPSQAQLQAKHFLSVGSSYAASLLRLLRNRPFMLLVLSYGINVGSLYAISTLLNQMIIGSYPGQEENAGRIGLTLILSGILGAFLCGIWLDRTKLFKQTLFAMYILTLIGMLVFTFTLSLGHLWLVFITVGTLGFFMSGYLPLGFEYGIELTYPEAEGTSSGMLNVLAQIFGIIFTICDEKVIDKWGTLAGNIFLTCFLLIGTIITGLIKSDLRRQQANVENCLSTPTGSESLAQDYGATGWSGTWQ
ncbi:feline leukemia virus subgroup C receptor-related protein 2 [Takifugu flavidus]|uniref:feline leukemia virus subgroup C receptor-related protein 2 n=1 Tax=Takifugu flavidus TaxID=433684 RepID=UPI0025448E55|nr:feline leukemia virus subgroup C receptor-related protein 2 [Takifugu flavidus]XP_056915424.1 feline leukemia virus subgroup C receptor-related protein 2 [Takifugu flavidus]